MLPKLDSVEWSTWGVGQKMDALNQAIHSIHECLDGLVNKLVKEEIEGVRDAREDAKKAKAKRR